MHVCGESAGLAYTPVGYIWPGQKQLEADARAVVVNTHSEKPDVLHQLAKLSQACPGIFSAARLLLEQSTTQREPQKAALSRIRLNSKSRGCALL